MVEFSRTREVTVRKARTCEWCGTPIRVGRRAVYRAYKWDGDFGTGHQHPECFRAMCASKDLEDGWVLGGALRGMTMEASQWLNEDIVPRSPVDLPSRLFAAAGESMIDQYDAMLMMDGGRIAMFYSLGMGVRNILRRMVPGWTDQDLDDQWELVVRAARVGRRATAEAKGGI
jgi:hypothetical protein